MKACPKCSLRFPDDAAFCFADGSPLRVLEDPWILQTIAGRYLVVERIGAGGMSSVYRAEHTFVERPCAIKILHAELCRDAVLKERFRREARSARALAHPNIIEIFDDGETELGVPYIVMELLVGRTLTDRIREGAIAWRDALPLLIQMARAIARAHDLGTVHRDLKPDNTFLCPRAPLPDLVKVLDFGIARSRTDSRLTSAGQLFGTPQYLAPERISKGAAGPSVDLYSFGVIAFEMLSGKLPLTAPDPAMFLIRHVRDVPENIENLVSDLPSELGVLVMSLLQKDPSARPVDAHRVLEELTTIAVSRGVPVPIEPADDPQVSSRSPARLLPAALHAVWSDRLELFDGMLRAAYPAGAPENAARSIERLRESVARLSVVHDALSALQNSIEQAAEQGTRSRHALGFAVDALGLDLSKARDELRGSERRLEESKRDVVQMREYYMRSQREVILWEGRSAFRDPSVELSAAYRACAVDVEAWRVARDRESHAASTIVTSETAARDLDYQIRELRSVLATREADMDSARARLEADVARLTAELVAIERSLYSEAGALAGPLRSRVDLAEFFRKLEASSAYQAKSASFLAASPVP